MAKNQIQFQKGYSLFEFQCHYGTEQLCQQALMTWRYTDGFICQECGGKAHCRLHSRPTILQCHNCHHPTSLTSGTLFVNQLLEEIERFLRPILVSEMQYQRSLAITHKLGDLLWRDDVGWAVCLKETQDKPRGSITIRLKGLEKDVMTGFYVNVSERLQTSSSVESTHHSIETRIDDEDSRKTARSKTNKCSRSRPGDLRQGSADREASDRKDIHATD